METDLPWRDTPADQLIAGRVPPSDGGGVVRKALRGTSFACAIDRFTTAAVVAKVGSSGSRASVLESKAGSVPVNTRLAKIGSTGLEAGRAFERVRPHHFGKIS